MVPLLFIHNFECGRYGYFYQQHALHPAYFLMRGHPPSCMAWWNLAWRATLLELIWPSGHCLPCTGAVVSSNINILFKTNFVWIVASKREEITKVLVLQQQVYQQELQAVVSTFFIQYPCKTRFFRFNYFCQCADRVEGWFLLKPLLQGLDVSQGPLEAEEALWNKSMHPSLPRQTQTFCSLIRLLSLSVYIINKTGTAKTK